MNTDNYQFIPACCSTCYYSYSFDDSPDYLFCGCEDSDFLDCHVDECCSCYKFEGDRFYN